MPLCVSLSLTARRSAISGGSGVLSRRHGTIFRESSPTACMIALWSSWRTQSDRLASADHSKTKASNAAKPSLSFPGMESPACISHSSNQTSRPLRTMCAPTERANSWSALVVAQETAHVLSTGAELLCSGCEFFIVAPSQKQFFVDHPPALTARPETGAIRGESQPRSREVFGTLSWEGSLLACVLHGVHHPPRQRTKTCSQSFVRWASRPLVDASRAEA